MNSWRKNWKKHYGFAIFAFLLASFLLFSAFRFETKPQPFLTRFDLAVLLETVLQNCLVEASTAKLPEFTDLTDSQKRQINRTLALNFMAGFPDRTFRPDQPLPSVETCFYLQKIASFLRRSHPESSASRQLTRILGYQNPLESFHPTLRSHFIPDELGAPTGFTDKAAFTRLIAAVNGEVATDLSLHGRIIDAVTGEAIASAYVAGARKAVKSDENGNFTLSFANMRQESVLLLATAENYQSLEIKKNLRINGNVIFRLRPLKRQAGHLTPRSH